MHVIVNRREMKYYLKEYKYSVIITFICTKYGHSQICNCYQNCSHLVYYYSKHFLGNRNGPSSLFGEPNLSFEFTSIVRQSLFSCDPRPPRRSRIFVCLHLVTLILHIVQPAAALSFRRWMVLTNWFFNYYNALLTGRAIMHSCRIFVQDFAMSPQLELIVDWQCLVCSLGRSYKMAHHRFIGASVKQATCTAWTT